MERVTGALVLNNYPGLFCGKPEVAAIHCPVCGSSQVYRSRTRGWREKLLKLMGYRAFRCHASACGWRSLVKVKEAAFLFQELWTKYRRDLVILLLLIGILLAAVYLLNLINFL